MPLKRQIYDVYLDPTDAAGSIIDGDVIELLGVEVRHGDMLRGELEANKNGISGKQVGDAPLNASSAWVWAALVRTKHIALNYRAFKAAAIAIQGHGDAGVVDVPPTPAPSNSDSSSPESSAAALPTGSTPTLTTD